MSAQWLSLGPLQDGRNLDEMTGGLPGVAAALVDCGGAALYLYQKSESLKSLSLESLSSALLLHPLPWCCGSYLIAGLWSDFAV